MEVNPLYDVVSYYYKVSTFGWIYEHVLQPMNGPFEWPKTNKITLLPPKFVRQAGRPKKVRRRDINELHNLYDWMNDIRNIVLNRPVILIKPT
ncbi:hypothetical protein Leryth_009671 [Lithospermum erythrorhizon]|nr:hypothetical protein Leryth_009671 [Lithospermum erythrorhizon]